jgi:3-oxoadipate enol-lactonase/4-carboxymuconolactone decarboxylase
MTTPDLAWTDFGGASDAPLLVVGPSLGTDVQTLWGDVASYLTDVRHIIGWDLPGHGKSATATGFTVAELADAVARHVPDAEFDYAGDSVGGAVGLELLVRSAGRVRTASLFATGAVIGTPEGWQDRAALVRSAGTQALLASTPGRWFADPDQVTEAQARLVDAVPEIDDASYAAVCEALAGHDLRDSLAAIETPVLAAAGAADQATPPASLRAIADGVQHGRFVLLDRSAHLPPVEQPADTTELVRAQLDAIASPRADRRADGMRVRREVLGDAHVDRASAAVTDFTADFQEFITRYAWGEVWTRPYLDPRSRSMITLTALIALGHHDEFAMHVRAARTNGLSLEEIREVILQSAIYCGVPAANTAYKIASEVLADEL